MGEIKTLIFDVLGTVVDEAGSIVAETIAALGGDDRDDRARQLTQAWNRRLEASIDDIVAGRSRWRSNDELRVSALRDAVTAVGVAELSPAAVKELGHVGHRLRPWPDSAAALEALGARYAVVALSNADLAQLVGMSAAGGLRWHGVLSGEMVAALKPDPMVYRLALDGLGLEAADTLMVAAHPWDLRAAAQLGMRTAYVSRDGEGVPTAQDRFDIAARDLAELTVRLGAERPA